MWLFFIAINLGEKVPYFKKKMYTCYLMKGFIRNGVGNGPSLK